jgi:hypothetical protein
VTVLAQAGVRVPQYVQEADQLTRFAVDARYPGLSSPVTKREHRRAVRIATGIVRLELLEFYVWAMIYFLRRAQ